TLGPSSAPDQGKTNLNQRAIASTSINPFSQTRKRKQNTAPKGETLALAGIDVSYHRLGPPSYECPHCHASMWYEERSNKARRVVNPSFSLCCQNENEVRNQIGAFIDNENGDGVDKTTVRSRLQMLDQYSGLAKAFRMARDWCHSHTSVNVELKLLSDKINARQYNGPTVSEVAALITNDFGDGIPTRNIIVNKQDRGPKRISELHPSYMALQYPLLFPYGEDGYHDAIPYYSNSGARKPNCGFVTMKEYYSYIIHHRKDQGTILVRGGRLFQQYLVDAYTAIKEQRLKWTRSNQDTLRVC
ncbi:DNA helicase PIF1, ATP-dependent, partial [Tanacetum coccineum]